MKGAFWLSAVLLSVLIMYYVIAQKNCYSPKYLELGKAGTINCPSPAKYYTVLWYTAEGFQSDIPAVHYQNLVTTGVGYESGEFDIHPNGSLIIVNVTLSHETTFTVAYTRSTTERVNVIHIRVVVIVKPEVPYPVIDLCNASNICYAEIDDTHLQCSVRGVRPNISLSWIARSVNGDKNISSEVMIVPEALGYTSRVTTRDVFLESPLLVYLVCTAPSQPNIFETYFSKILVKNKKADVRHIKPSSINVKREATLIIKCTDTVIGFIVWKKSTSLNYEVHELLLYSILIEGSFTKTFADDVFLGDGASLSIKSADLKHEGTYFCLYGDDQGDGAKAFNVNVIVPVYPLIEGCNRHQYCVLGAEYEGILNCTVKGIYPQVQLKWRTFSDNDAVLISFTNQHITTTENGETFDVTLFSTYRVRDESLEKLTLECEVVTTLEGLTGLTTTMDLRFIRGSEHGTEESYNNMTWIVVAVIVVVILISVMFGTIIFKRCFRKRDTSGAQSENGEEMTNMLGTTNPEADLFSDKKQSFIRQLQQSYKDLYDAVQPIPYIKDKYPVYCVDRVFVEGGIQYLERIVKEQWVNIDSYLNVFNDNRLQSTRRILEGEPGYGKSTVTLQFAYDWCNSVSCSPLKDVEVLILLRLRQLGGMLSIYSAIKQFILPKDSRISVSDIENILQNSHSVVIILDGFDEYPDQDNRTSDVTSIIAREMFQNFEVVLTTRSSFLPQKYPPLTKRFRLTGFDDNARRYYIRKAVVGNDDDESVKRIEGYLEENPILSDLCQVPLLFVIFAHMTYESEDFRKLNSVTSFFRYMISCFHSHMRNKMNEENVSKYELFETDHGVLDKVAFEAFSGNSQRIVWKKDELCEQLGGEFYDQYIRIGILVEEEVINIIDDPSTPITEHVQYKKEVRFYHKLFCEWYAAHYLSDYIQQNPNLDLSTFLQNLDPFDVQYLYRFACGLNSNTAEKIIAHLKNSEGRDKFAILCILEQTGKIDNIMETIRQLCSEGIIISAYDSLLLQRSSLQLLEIAARNGIPIEHVQIHNCLQSVDLSTATINTSTGLSLSAKIPFKRLAFRFFNRVVTEEEYISVLKFSSMCETLCHLGIYGSVPPRFFEVELTLANLKSRDVTVKYYGSFVESKIYTLNLQSGRWESEVDGRECTEEDFKSMTSDWVKVQGKTLEEYKKAIKDYREVFSVVANETSMNPRKDDADGHTDDIMKKLRIPRGDEEHTLHYQQPSSSQ